MKKIIGILLISFTLAQFSFPDNYAYIEKMFEIRATITEHDKKIPAQMQRYNGANGRTLERIFELNTSALTTIEAYFRMLEVALSADEIVDRNVVKILNEWLEFIKTQCIYDLEYINEAINETQDIDIMVHLYTAKNNIEKLANISAAAIDQNNIRISSN